MTQAFNLSQLANNLNTSGQLDATDGLTGALPVGNGGTGLTSVGTSGNVLTSNGSVWTSTAPASPTPADGSITDPKIADGITAGTNWFPLYTIESNDFSGTQAVFINENLGNLLVWTGRVLRGGTYRFRTSVINQTGGGNNCTYGFRIYQNGVALGSQTTANDVSGANGIGIITSSDVTLTTGSVVQFYCQNITANRIGRWYQLQCGVSNTLKVIPISQVSVAISPRGLSI
jgi:hypothetical protein